MTKYKYQVGDIVKYEVDSPHIESIAIITGIKSNGREVHYYVEGLYNKNQLFFLYEHEIMKKIND